MDIFTMLYLLIGGLLAVYGSASIVVATVRKPNLRHNCNIFIAFQAVCLLCQAIGTLNILLLSLFDSLDQPAIHCFFIQLVPQFSMTCGVCFALVIGVDRLISVKWPHVYSKIEPIPYIPAVCLLPCSVALFVEVCAYYMAFVSSEKTVLCTINGVLVLRENYLFYLHFLHAFVAVATLLIYMQMWRTAKDFPLQTRRLIKSLFAIVISFVITWLVTSGLLSVVYIAGIQDPYRFAIRLLTLGSISLCGFFDFVIYYNMNSEYRQAFQEQMCFSPQRQTNFQVKMLRRKNKPLQFKARTAAAANIRIVDKPVDESTFTNNETQQ
ncbi:unnamed protein product [Bursaphelenchus xylophilus]|uniref:(pine wood nematode) hypothetical protein n=1 Tax=Bursaphelenchus xylophilus TaxID=6326 RepID=A0A1I7SRT1_BURXY|nr:unnamed protein product [Bursaphelenchus xylophilus]CAG9101880.1 unnamed protein product [Bursaphelenchus xylophilus]